MKSAHGVARTSQRRLCHPARASLFLGRVPKTLVVFFPFCPVSIPLFWGVWTQNLQILFLGVNFFQKNENKSERLDFSQIIILDVWRIFLTSVLFVTATPVGGTMYCHPYTCQWSGCWMVELVSWQLSAWGWWTWSIGVSVSYFVFFNRYWGIVSVPGFLGVNRSQIIIWGGRILTLHLLKLRCWL